VREADRHQELAMQLVVELVALPPPVRGRGTPQVDGDVPDRAAQAANELRLARGGLEVEPAQDAAARARVVLLHELEVHPQLAPRVVAERLDEEPAVVAVHVGLDEDEALDLGVEAPGHYPSARPYWRS
jgi:hypothetical protein